MVETIKIVIEEIHLVTNVGVRINNQKAKVSQYREVWYDKEVTANFFQRNDYKTSSDIILK